MSNAGARWTSTAGVRVQAAVCRNDPKRPLSGNDELCLNVRDGAQSGRLWEGGEGQF